MTDLSKEGRAERPLHPYCNVCGWRKGGVDSWTGKACKCGLWEPAMPERGMEAVKAAIERVVPAKARK